MDFGPHKYNAKLHINRDPAFLLSSPMVIDIETDERDKFVGIGLTSTGMDIFYITDLKYVRDYLLGSQLITHGGKFDLIQLRKWGIDIQPKQLLYDTQIMAYMYDNIQGKYGLKNLAKKYLGMTWPTYEEITGTGKKKITLDKHPIETVANYCGMDTLATFKLYKYLNARLLKSQKQYLNEIEMPFYRALIEMEEQGIQVDVNYLKKLDKQFEEEMILLESTLNGYVQEPFNPRSPKQVIKALKENKINVISSKSKILKEFKEKPIIRDLLNYREVNKLKTTYTNVLLQHKTLPRIYSYFNPCGTITGRLTSSNPNLQTIPTRTIKGKLMRKVFIAKPGYKLLVADYSNIEPRFVAHFSQDPVLLEIFNSDKNFHEVTAQKLNLSKEIAKTFNLATTYGSGAKTLADEANISISNALKYLEDYWKLYKGLNAWCIKQKFYAHKYGGIRTYLGKFIPLVGINGTDMKRRFFCERCAVDYPCQSSVSELIKLAMIKLHENAYIPILQVHDELLFEVEEERAEHELSVIKYIMENAIQLSVPLKVEIKIGNNWGECK